MTLKIEGSQIKVKLDDGWVFCFYDNHHILKDILNEENILISPIFSRVYGIWLTLEFELG